MNLTELIQHEADKYAFQVPFNGTNEFYNEEKLKGFEAGANFMAKHILGFAEYVLKTGHTYLNGRWYNPFGFDRSHQEILTLYLEQLNNQP